MYQDYTITYTATDSGNHLDHTEAVVETAPDILSLGQIQNLTVSQ